MLQKFLSSSPEIRKKVVPDLRASVAKIWMKQKPFPTYTTVINTFFGYFTQPESKAMRMFIANPYVFWTRFSSEKSNIYNKSDLTRLPLQ